MDPHVEGASAPWAGCSLYIESEELPESWVLWLLFLELVSPLLFCLVYVLGREALPVSLAPSFVLSMHVCWLQPLQQRNCLLCVEEKVSIHSQAPG